MMKILFDSSENEEREHSHSSRPPINKSKEHKNEAKAKTAASTEETTRGELALYPLSLHPPHVISPLVTIELSGGYLHSLAVWASPNDVLVAASPSTPTAAAAMRPNAATSTLTLRRKFMRLMVRWDGRQ